MDIGEVVKQSGVSASALRFYEEKGLIQSNGRIGLRRQYAESIIERLGLIALARAVGFSLDDIAAMFRTGRINRSLLTQKADELDKRIAQLSAMRDGLRHAVACTAPSHFECPKFLRLLSLAGKTARRQRNRQVATKQQNKKDK
jgi:DNA-binding transcriptional MerR regulator